MAKYDVVIAGSGLGGLECAVILSKEGYNVCVLEKNLLFGGCLQTYTRKGHKLDTGIHYVGSFDEGQVMHQYFKYFGIIDKLNLQRLDSESFDRILYGEKVYDYAIGRQQFLESLSQHFPQERENLKRYLNQLQDIGRLINVDSLKQGVIAHGGMAHFATSASKRIAELTANETLQNVLAATSLLYGGVKESSTFYHHAMINNSYIESAYRFNGGTMQIADRLIDVVRQNGGSVFNRKEVTRFIVNDNEVTAVELNGGEELIEGKYFISNIHPKRTLQLLDKNRYIKNAYISRINSLPNSFGIFTLYLVMKKGACPYINRNSYIHGEDDVWYNGETSKGKVSSCMINFQRADDAAYTDVVIILTPMYISELAKWEHTTVENRGEDYLQFKSDFSKKILDFLKKHGIDFGDSIEEIYSTTPLSYRDYMGTSDGAAYGIIKDYKYPQVGFVSTSTKLKNLFFTGQNLNVHGALGVTLTAMFTCSEFLGQEYLAKKVGNA